MNRIASLWRSEESPPSARTLSDVREGQRVFVTPWALRFTEWGAGYLDPETPCAPEALGTAALPVLRGKEGFVAEVSRVRFRWIRDDEPINQGVPVIEFR